MGCHAQKITDTLPVISLSSVIQTDHHAGSLPPSSSPIKKTTPLVQIDALRRGNGMGLSNVDTVLSGEISSFLRKKNTDNSGSATATTTRYEDDSMKKEDE